VWTELSERLTDWQGLLTGTPAEARGVLRELVQGRFIMTPTPGEGGAWYYTLSGRATYGRVLTGIVPVEHLPMSVVPPG
jgi:hypothetical protein